jgi:hypothetical protein
MRWTDRRRLIAEALAAAFLDGDWSSGPMAERAVAALGRPRDWLRPLARRMVRTFPAPPRDAPGELARAIEAEKGLREDPTRWAGLRVIRHFLPSPEMRRDRPDWGAISLGTTGDLASWLGEVIGDLEWLADVRGLGRHPRDPRLGHYVHRWVPKRSGGMRLLEAPKPRLKAIQRRILHAILDRVPPHDAVHGFRAGRSVLTNAQLHAGRAVVVRMDLEDFFVSVATPRVHGVFRTLGYPEEVSRVLTALCTARAPLGVMPNPSPYLTREQMVALDRTRRRYRARHLPQGAPTSPSLANLTAYGMDCASRPRRGRLERRTHATPMTSRSRGTPRSPGWRRGSRRSWPPSRTTRGSACNTARRA